MHLNVGYNFDPGLAHILDAINMAYGGKNDFVTSVYGSIRKHADWSARPDFRLPDVSLRVLEDSVKLLDSYNIEFNYALNSPNPCGSKPALMDRLDEFCQLCEYLAGIGVKRFIIANPILIEVLKRHLPQLDIEIELSTIMHIDTPMQLQAFKQLDSRVTRVVGNILYNRDFRKLRAFTSICARLGMEYEVMVNEFCLTATGKAEEPIAAHCIFRDSCYNCHATNQFKSEALMLHNYPMGKCMTSRAFIAADWLRTFTYRPQDLHYLEEAGIEHFKVTGRTGSSQYIALMAKAYLTRKWEGNYLELWKPLETIYNDKPEAEHKHRHYIDTTKMDGFIEAFVRSPAIDCNMITCDQCRYCDEFIKENQ